MATLPNHTLSRGVLSSATFGLSSMAAQLALLPLILSTVGAAPYGVWLLVSTLATYLYQADLGMGSAIVHFLSKGRSGRDGDAAITVSTGFFWMAAAGLIALPIYLALALTLLTGTARGAGLTSEDTTALVLLGAVLLSALGLRAFPAVLQGSGYWVYQRNTQMAGVGVRIAGTIAACLIFDTIVAVAVAEALALVVPMLLSTLKAYRLGLAKLAPRRVTRDDFRTMFQYGIRSFAVGAMAAILLQADTLIVGALLTATAVTYYSAAFRIYMAVRQILGWVTEPLLPTLSRLFPVDAQRALTAVSGLQFATLWIAAGACLTLMIAAPQAIGWWLGDAVPQQDVAVVLAILLCGLMVNATHLAAIPAASAAGRPGAFVRLHATWCGLNVALSLGLGAWLGIAGVALGTTLPLLLLEPLYLRQIQRVLGLSARRWVRQCLLPVALPALFGLAAAGSVLGTAWSLGDLDGAWVLGAVAFAASYVLATRLTIRFVPHQAVRVALSTKI